VFSSVQFTAVRFLQIKHLAAEDLNSAVELDRLCFGGLWTLEGYGRELGSPNTDLLGLWASQTGSWPIRKIRQRTRVDRTQQHSQLKTAQC
jgi:hypothetical protein